MNWWQASEEGLILKLRVIPRASRSRIEGLHDGALKIRLQAPPVDGKANKALYKLLARTTGLSTSRIEILSGSTGRHKRVLLRGAGKMELQTLASEMQKGTKPQS